LIFYVEMLLDALSLKEAMPALVVQMIDLVYINRLDWLALRQSGHDRAAHYDNHEGCSAKCFDGKGPAVKQRQLSLEEPGTRPYDRAARPDSGRSS
jgi:hypothetical protein